MEILLWLVPPAVVTVVAMIWVSWVGRAEDEGVDRSDAAQERFARAILKEHPSAGRPRRRPSFDRSTGIAVRPSRAASRPTGSDGNTRHTA